MLPFPTRRQWKNWSLPSKLTAIGCYVGILALFITVVLYFLDSKKDYSQNIPSSTVVHEFPYLKFNEIRGPALSDKENFGKLCVQLIMEEFPIAQPIKDYDEKEYMDIFVGTLYPNQSIITVFQSKFYTDTLTISQKSEIHSSLITAIQQYSPRDCILCIPKTLTLLEKEWWDDLVNQHSNTEIYLWDETILRQLIIKHPEIRKKYFPQKFSSAQMDQLRQIMIELVSPLPEDMAFLLQVENIAKKNQLDPNILQSQILDWCLSAKEPLDIGIRSLLLSDFEEAKLHLRKSIEADQYMLSQKKMLLGNAQLCLDSIDQAIISYRESLNLNSNNLYSLVNIGVAYRLNREFEHAINTYRRTLEINSSIPQIHNNLGVALENIGQFEEAIASYTKALELDSRCFPALYNRAIAYGLYGEFDKAVQDFQLAVKSIQYFENLEGIGARNPLFPYKSLGSLLLEGLFPELHESQEKLDKSGMMKGSFRDGARLPTLSYSVPQGLSSEVLSQSVLMFYNYSPRNLEQLRHYIMEYCKNRHSHFGPKG